MGNGQRDESDGVRIRALGVGSLGERYWGTSKGSLFALLPDPVDADACLEQAAFTSFADSDATWDRDFERVVLTLLQALSRRSGEPRVVAPRHSTGRSWRELVEAAFLGKTHDIRNPSALSPIAALLDHRRQSSPVRKRGLWRKIC
jgi:hypothetical protein